MLFLLLLLSVPVGKGLYSICFLFGIYEDHYIPALLSFSLVLSWVFLLIHRQIFSCCLQNWHTGSTDSTEHPEQSLPCNVISQSCLTADVFLISVNYKFISYPKRKAFSCLSQDIVLKIKITWFNKIVLFSYPANLKSQMTLQVYMMIVHPQNLKLSVFWRLWHQSILLDQLYKDFKKNWIKPGFTWLWLLS